MTLITDGLPAYHDAYKKEFWTLRNPRTEHVRVPNIRDRSNNNMVKRLNGTVRERDKVLRALKKKEGNQVIDGFRIYYNFIRSHQSLNGKHQQRWQTLI